MKKIIFLVALVAISSTSFAKKCMVVKDGNICDALGKVTEAVVEFDYSETTWEEDEDYATFCGDSYDMRVASSVVSFADSFNEYSKALKVNQNSTSPSVKIVVKVIDLERNINLMTGQANIELRGNIKVFDMNTNDLLVEVVVDDLEGDWDYVPDDRLNKCFYALAQNFVLLGKKCK